MKKSVIAILMTTVIVVSLMAPLLPTVQAADPSDWYMTVNGVLNTDYYLLYPFSTAKSLKIGFSKFGEMIDSSTNVGLEYGAVDPFAPPAGASVYSIVKSAWLNGWLINITYWHNIRGELRTVWASAQHGDPQGVTYGNDWIRVDFANDKSATYGLEDPRDPGYFISNYAAGGGKYGGRKTNGTAVTTPIQVLYDGPRSFVALLTTTIYDHFVYESGDTAEDIPLLEVRLMIMFNKVKKEVVVLKELKTLVSDKYADELKVQFSNRGEVDLGVEDTGYASYFHFYTQGKSRGPNWEGTGKNYENNDTLAEGRYTVYNSNWVMNQTENPKKSTWYNYSAAGPYPQTDDATYDVAVAVNPTAGYTWWAAFWPSLSDWSIDGWPMWWRSMEAVDPHDIDSRTWQTPPRIEPTIPYYIGEWDVVLLPTGKTTTTGDYNAQQYRFVTIYGVTDRNDAKDANMAGGSNVIDAETKYLLEEYFNPWDLYSAVEKETKSWVEWKGPGSTSYTLANTPFKYVENAAWDQYCVFSERVIDTTSNKLLKRVKYVGGSQVSGDYSLSYNPATGVATISGLNASRVYKILYNTYTRWSANGILDFPFFETGTADSEGDKVELWDSDYESWSDPLGATHRLELDDIKIEAELLNATIGDFTASFTIEDDWGWADYYKVFKGQTSVISWDHDELLLRSNENVSTTTWFDVHWYITAPQHEDIHIWDTRWYITIDITIDYNATEDEMNITAAVSLAYSYSESNSGRYEWIAVGRDAASVDSAGAALVSAAFKNKQVEIGLAGADMYNSVVANQMPWVMSNKNLTAGNAWENYYYSGTDYRTALRDDWCKAGTLSGDEWPVASSNMIGVGGPLANLFAYYANDFTDAFFGLDQFTNYSPWENKIVPKTCWDHTTAAYSSSSTTGYAVVTTYKDLNGTVLFLIWGHWGRDTYYTSKWFHEEGIYELQQAPAGVTSLVVKITYESTDEGYKPKGWSIPEVLGTISERLWKHGTIKKGGIHDP